MKCSGLLSRGRLGCSVDMDVLCSGSELDSERASQRIAVAECAHAKRQTGLDYSHDRRLDHCHKLRTLEVEAQPFSPPGFGPFPGIARWRARPALPE
jgi:hypothetical protein